MKKMMKKAKEWIKENEVILIDTAVMVGIIGAGVLLGLCTRIVEHAIKGNTANSDV